MIELPKETFELYIKLDRAELVKKDGKYYFENEEIVIMKGEENESKDD